MPRALVWVMGNLAVSFDFERRSRTEGNTHIFDTKSGITIVNERPGIQLEVADESRV